MKPLPCPFCGDEPVVVPDDPVRQGNAWAEVMCCNPRCATFDERLGQGVSVRDGAKISDERGAAAYKRLAIRRWNRRAALSAGKRENP